MLFSIHTTVNVDAFSDTLEALCLVVFGVVPASQTLVLRTHCEVAAVFPLS